ncbi:MAG: hypothetical protein N3A38_04265 [Planctomycetota bacterium]|nr:hypothetical protein [Planctomycetota bacterium]
MNGSETSHLRELAGKYAGYALGEVMNRRREKWRLHNALRERTFPFHIEDNGTFLRDLSPPLRCGDEDARWLEARLVGPIVSYERIDDDRIIPARFVVNWVTAVSSYCPELAFRRLPGTGGPSLAYESNRPIRDIDADFGKLRKRTMTLDREKTERRAELARKVFQGLLPVEVGRCGSMYSDGIANKAVHLLGMQELYMEMASNPDAVHRLLTFLAGDNIALGRWEEDQGLLTLNNDGNQGYCSGSSQFSDEIPGREIRPGERVLSSDRYGYLEAQEAVGISPAMFDEFLMPHFLEISRKFRLMKFGCCEPVHGLMPHLMRLHGLRKVSVSPWCDLRKLAEVCRRDIIWSRKPAPLKLCGETFDPEAFRAHLQETLDIGKDFFIEFIFRDTTSLTGAMEGRIKEACRIVREITGSPEGSRF